MVEILDELQTGQRLDHWGTRLGRNSNINKYAMLAGPHLDSQLFSPDEKSSGLYGEKE